MNDAYKKDVLRQIEALMRGPKGLAREIIEPFDIAYPPIPVTNISRHYGVDVLGVPQAPWSGRLENETGSAARIIVNNAEEDVFQRVMIAYELGRYFFSPPGSYEDQYEDTWKNWKKDGGVYEFAIRLLVPTDLLFAVIMAFGVDTPKLARAFKVHKNIIIRRGEQERIY